MNKVNEINIHQISSKLDQVINEITKLKNAAATKEQFDVLYKINVRKEKYYANQMNQSNN